jgi:hypothetical protein
MTPPRSDHRTNGRDAGKEIANSQKSGALATDVRHSRMTVITVKFTPEELDLLTALASDQLFRRQYIDPRMPGYKSNPAEVRAGKELVERLRQMADRAKGTSSPKRNGATA